MVARAPSPVFETIHDGTSDLGVSAVNDWRDYDTSLGSCYMAVISRADSVSLVGNRMSRGVRQQSQLT